MKRHALIRRIDMDQDRQQSASVVNYSTAVSIQRAEAQFQAAMLRWIKQIQYGNCYYSRSGRIVERRTQ